MDTILNIFIFWVIFLVRRIVYDFWAGDFATEVVKEKLEGLKIPFEVKIERRVREPLAPKDCRYDYWAKIYVDTKELVKWLEKTIEDTIRGY